MKPTHPNVAMLEVVAKALGPLCDEVVFVGGCAAGLLLTQTRADSIRVTEDVDLVASAVTTAEFHATEVLMRRQGFSNDMRPAAPICRWVYAGVTVDLMPCLATAIGFANRWYPLAVATATSVTLPSGQAIRLIAAPVFIATKLEAFKDRGRTSTGALDMLGSHDLEDIVSVIDRRPELLEECQSGPDDLRAYLASEFQQLLQAPGFIEALPGHLPADTASQMRLGRLLTSIRTLAHRAG